MYFDFNDLVFWMKLIVDEAVVTGYTYFGFFSEILNNFLYFRDASGIIAKIRDYVCRGFAAYFFFTSFFGISSFTKIFYSKYPILSR